MIRLVFNISTIIIFALLTVGCDKKYEGIDKVSKIDSASLRITEKATGVIDLKPIRKMLAKAQWIDNQPINKGGYWLEINGFPDIFVSEVNGCFWMSDYRGLFKIADKERPLFYEYLDGQVQRILKKSNQQK